MYIPSILVDTYIDYALENNINISNLLPGQDVYKSSVDITRYIMLIDSIKSQLPNRDIGFDIGWRFTPQLFEPIGPAMLSSKNLAIALNILVKYWDLFCVGLDMKVIKNERNVDLIVETTLPINEEYQRIILKSAVICFYKTILQMYPHDISEIIISFRDKPLLDDINKIIFQTKASSWKVTFPIRLLTDESFCSNSISFNREISKCDSIIKLIEANNQFNEFLNQTLYEKASEKFVSTKTFYRKLKKQGHSFQKLKQSKKYALAIILLKNKDLTIEQISFKLGYKDPSNFTRAFKRWSHISPSEYRRNNS